MEYRRLTLALAITVAMSATSTYAQDSEDEADAELENITVSGSGLKRTNFESAAPVASISAEDIRRAPQTTLGDLLNELPQLRATFRSYPGADQRSSSCGRLGRQCCGGFQQHPDGLGRAH